MTSISLLSPDNMKFATSTFFSLFATSFSGLPKAVWSQALTEPDANCVSYLQEALDCIDSDETKKCAPLPIPQASFGPVVDPEKGYVIESPRPSVYGVTQGLYWWMIFVGDAVDLEVERSGGPLLRGRRKQQEDAMFPPEESDDDLLGVKVLIMDFPQNVNISASLDEVLMEKEGLEVDDIGEIMMLYSHDHLDHIGGAG